MTARRVALATALAVAAISVLSSLGYGPTLFGFVTRIPGRDATGHLAVTFLLAAVVNRGYGAPSEAWHRGVLNPTAAVLLAVVLEELSQVFIPARSLNRMDMSMNVAGVVSGGLAVWAFRALRSGSDSA